MAKEKKQNLDESKLKSIVNKIKSELIDDSDIKSYILYRTDKDTKNMVLFKNPNMDHDFELPTTKEKFSLVESAFEIEGVPVFIIQRDRHDSIPMNFLQVKEDKSEEIIEKPRTSSELYHIHRSSAMRRKYPIAKLDFNMKITFILGIVIAVLSTVLILFPFLDI